MAAIHVAALLSHPAVRSAIERALAARGVRGDTMIAHIDPREAAMLRFMGGAGTVNPRTGLRQFYNPDAGHADPTGSAGVDSTGGGDNSGLGQGVSGQGGSGGSGLGAGGGHSGQNYYSQNYYTNPAPAAPAPSYVAPAPINNMPAPAPVSLTPMMSSTATTDLASSRFGALPSWATTPYQIGMAPSSYPTPGVNAALGAPGTGGGALPGGGGGVLGGGVGSTGGGITPVSGAQPITNLVTGQTSPSPVVHTPNGLGVQLPNGSVALINQNTLTLPNGQTLTQYLTSLKLGLAPNMPGAPASAMAQAAPAVQAAAQPVASRLATASQAAPGAIQQQIHPAVANALAQGILGGTIPNYAQQVARGKVTSGSR